MTGLPNCVPEYFREQEEAYERECELAEKRNSHYLKNREKLRKAQEDGFPILNYEGYPECHNCSNKDSDTQVSEMDDFATIICLNKDCPCHKLTQKEKNSEAETSDFSETEFTIDDYVSKELLEKGTVEAVKEFAGKNYSKGGDAIIECLEDSQIEQLLKDGPAAVLNYMYTWYMQCEDVRKTIW